MIVMTAVIIPARYWFTLCDPRGTSATFKIYVGATLTKLNELLPFASQTAQSKHTIVLAK